MYKSDNKLQSSFLDFNQPMGKRISAKMLMEANEYLLQENKPDKKEDENNPSYACIHRRGIKRNP